LIAKRGSLRLITPSRGRYVAHVALLVIVLFAFMLPVTFAGRSVVPVCSRNDLGCIELGVLETFVVFFTGDFVLILLWQWWAVRSLTVHPLSVADLQVHRAQPGIFSQKLHATDTGQGPPIVVRVGGQRRRMREALQIAGQQPLAPGPALG
jgi:hypothetical protein